MENTFENALKFVRTLDERGSEWSESEKTLAAAMVDYHNEVVNKNALLADASGSLPVACTMEDDKGELEWTRLSVEYAGEVITSLTKKVKAFEEFIDSFNENYR